MIKLVFLSNSYLIFSTEKSNSRRLSANQNLHGQILNCSYASIKDMIILLGNDMNIVLVMDNSYWFELRTNVW